MGNTLKLAAVKWIDTVAVPYELKMSKHTSEFSSAYAIWANAS
jgi:hypothetical protein